MKAIVLFSGGLDSTTCLALAIQKYGAENVLALTVYYGQKHKKEIESAKKIVNYYHCHYQELNLKPLFENAKCSLLEGQASIPHESYKKQITKTQGKPVSTYVPFRNGLFLSVATSIALANHCLEIYYGAHQDDAAGNAYPDTSQEFNQAMNHAIFLGSGNQIQVVAPFINKSKKDIVKIGLELEVPYELTWSCYEGKEKACGRCGTCIDRKNAFLANHVKDPIVYEDE